MVHASPRRYDSSHTRQTNRPGIKPEDIGPAFTLVFAVKNVGFRTAEFEAVTELLKIPYAFVRGPNALVDAVRPGPAQHTAATDDEPGFNGASTRWIESVESMRALQLVHLPSNEAVYAISARLSSLRAAFRHWYCALDAGVAFERLADQSVSVHYATHRQIGSSWKVSLNAINRHIHQSEMQSTVQRIGQVMDLSGPISLKTPVLDLCWFEEYESPDVGPAGRTTCGPLRAIHVGDRVPLVEPTGRELIEKMSLKTRGYIGNTSMETEMAIIQANMAQAGPSKLVYDPFVGTGSLLYPCAQFGAMICGSDIDGRMIRGKEGPTMQEGGAFGGRGANARTGIDAAAQQYGLAQNLVGLWTADITNSPLRKGIGTGIFDAIVTDPPYGVRAGAKKLGRRDVSRQAKGPILMPDGKGYTHEQVSYVPPSKPYHLDELIEDLIETSSKLLIEGGRLVFWLPTIFSEDGKNDQSVSLPAHPAFRLVAHSMQDFGRWGRRLVTMELLPIAQRLGNAAGSFDGRLEFPEPPRAHKKAGKREEALNSTGGRIRADADAKEFRNRYYRSRDVPSESQGASPSSRGRPKAAPASTHNGKNRDESTKCAASGKIVAVIGSTGTGKSQLAVELAREVALRAEVEQEGRAAGAEVISSDSMQMYCGLDVITNKATLDEMAGVKHHLMNFLKPGQQYTIGEFVKEANAIIQDLSERNKIAIVAGGTTYYVQHLLFPGRLVSLQRESDDWRAAEDERPLALSHTAQTDLDEILAKLDEGQRRVWDALAAVKPGGRLPPYPRVAFWQLLDALDPDMARRWHWNDHRKVSRSLRVLMETGKRHSDWIRDQENMDRSSVVTSLAAAEPSSVNRPEQCSEPSAAAKSRKLILWVWSEPEELRERLAKRVDKMVEGGLLDEIQSLRRIAAVQSAQAGATEMDTDYTCGIYQAIGYKEFADYLSHCESVSSKDKEAERLFAHAIERMQIGTRQYAKSQTAWIRNKLAPELQKARIAHRKLQQAKGSDEPCDVELYLLDASDLSRWKESVRDPAIELVNAFLLDEKLPEPRSLSSAAATQLPPLEISPSGPSAASARVHQNPMDRNELRECSGGRVDETFGI
ncbi:trna isopentenyltransferase [Ceraceosorus bombacis]|uniref:tRNA (guanine(10)-N(2))-methyltransferase n=1 Tax=Ceraceosorus bombacis TaxID=401625 RepID=A0A0N7L9Y0_9BASI|nr:trna isopentenyltransferase [Ceraceosorus bombacis]